jgi:hypothetical protein
VLAGLLGRALLADRSRCLPGRATGEGAPGEA